MPLRLPGKLRLKTVEPQKIFCDEFSEEKITRVKKRKYKLAANCILAKINVYTFFITTTNVFACSQHRIEVRTHHLENKSPQYLNEHSTYIDARDVEFLTEKELIGKMDDPRNLFLLVARLCDEKYEELKKLKDEVHKGGFISTEKIALVREALSDVSNPANVCDEMLIKLGLN